MKLTQEEAIKLIILLGEKTKRHQLVWSQVEEYRQDNGFGSTFYGYSALWQGKRLELDESSLCVWFGNADQPDVQLSAEDFDELRVFIEIVEEAIGRPPAKVKELENFLNELAA